MTFNDWITEPANWAFLVIAIPVVISAFRVVTTRNIVHAVLFLVLALAGSAALFILLSAEFVAWVLVLVYIGAVVVLFLFGIMITRAPIGYETSLDHANRLPAVLAAAATFVLTAWVSIAAFGEREISNVGSPTATEIIGVGIIEQFVIPFEAVGFILLAALIGGVTLARKDLTPAEEDEASAV